MTKAQERNQAAQMLSEQALQLEYQLNNQAFQSVKEYKAVKNKYKQVASDLMKLLSMEAQDLKYPLKMEEWDDLYPMQRLNTRTMNQLMQTDWYQELINKRILT